MLKYIFLFSILLSLTPSGVLAQDELLPLAPISVTVRIEVSDRNIFFDQVEVSTCTITDTAGNVHAFSQAEAVCALDAAAQLGGFAYEMTDFGFGLFLSSVAGYEGGVGGLDWIYWVNYQNPPVGMDQHRLTENDEMVLALSAWNQKLLRLTGPAEVETAQEFTILAEAYDARAQEFVAVSGARIFGSSYEFVTDNQGKARITLSQHGRVQFTGEAEGCIRSAALAITVQQHEEEVPSEPPMPEHETPLPDEDPVSNAPEPEAEPVETAQEESTQEETSDAASEKEQQSVTLPQQQNANIPLEPSFTPLLDEYFAVVQAAETVQVPAALGAEKTAVVSSNSFPSLVEVKASTSLSAIQKTALYGSAGGLLLCLSLALWLRRKG